MSLLTKRLVFLGISIFFFSSFLFAPTFLNGNLVVKQFGVELIISVFSILVCCAALIKKNLSEIKLNIIDLLVILLLFTYTGSLLIFNYSPGEHSLPYYYVLLYLISVSIVHKAGNTETFKKSFLILVLLTIVAHIVIVALQQIKILPPLHGYFNNGSTFGNPDMLGSYIAVLLPFCFMQKDKLKRAGYVVFLISIILLVYVQARSALFAIILCGFLWLILNKGISKKQFILLFSIAVVVLGLLIFWHPESVYGRFFIWFISIKMIIHKPFGWGIMAFEKHYPEFQASYLSNSPNILKLINPDIVHSPFNEFLNVGVTTGITGLLIYILVVAVIFYYAIKSRSRLIYPIFIFFILSLFYFPSKISSLLIIVVPLLSVVSDRIKPVITKKLPGFGNYILIPVILFSLYVAFNSVSQYRNYKSWQQAVLFFKDERNLTESEELFTSLYPEMKENGRFLITYSNLKYKQGFPEKALALLEEAEMYFCDIVLLLKLAKLYEELEMYEQAEDKFDLAINISPNSFTAPYEKILFLQNIGEHERAYSASLNLVDKPIRNSVYADPIIIKSRLRKLIGSYELQNSE